jgi:hypothetical protein
MTCEGQIMCSFQEKLIYIATLCESAITPFAYFILLHYLIVIAVDICRITAFRYYLHIFIYLIIYIALICIVIYSLGFKKNWIEIAIYRIYFKISF